jgi:hypothetical protein
MKGVDHLAIFGILERVSIMHRFLISTLFGDPRFVGHSERRSYVYMYIYLWIQGKAILVVVCISIFRPLTGLGVSSIFCFVGRLSSANRISYLGTSGCLELPTRS